MMQPAAEEYSTYSCATLRYLVDPVREMTVPIGVLLWNTSQNWYRMRLPNESEKIENVLERRVRPILEAIEAQIEDWVLSSELPYDNQQLQPLSNAWWSHVQKLLKFSIRLEAIRPIDCISPDQEIETLFDALVQPSVPDEEMTTRIDSAVTKALGNLTRYFSRGDVPGYHGRQVPVLRQMNSANGYIVLEAVNLAAKSAEKDADALYGQLSRIREADGMHDTRFVLGYLASPSGLNGEGPLKDFIEDKVGTRMFDLTRQAEEFRHKAYEELQGSKNADALFGPYGGSSY